MGSRLLRLAEEQAHARGLPEVRLYTNEAMTENLDYYPRRRKEFIHFSVTARPGRPAPWADETSRTPDGYEA